MFFDNRRDAHSFHLIIRLLTMCQHQDFNNFIQIIHILHCEQIDD